MWDILTRWWEKESTIINHIISTYTDILHDFNIRRRSCRLTLTWRVPLSRAPVFTFGFKWVRVAQSSGRVGHYGQNKISQWIFFLISYILFFGMYLTKYQNLRIAFQAYFKNIPWKSYPPLEVQKNVIFFTPPCH